MATIWTQNLYFTHSSALQQLTPTAQQAITTIKSGLKCRLVTALENLFIYFAQLKIPQLCLKHWAQKIGSQKTVSIPALLPEESFGT